MSNLEILQKLTLGTEATETITVNGEEIEIRPLTSGELSELQTIEKKGFVMKVGLGAKGKRTKVETNNTDDCVDCVHRADFLSLYLHEAGRNRPEPGTFPIQPERTDENRQGIQCFSPYYGDG